MISVKGKDHGGGQRLRHILFFFFFFCRGGGGGGPALLLVGGILTRNGTCVPSSGSNRTGPSGDSEGPL